MNNNAIILNVGNNSGKYKMETIQNSVFYAREL